MFRVNWYDFGFVFSCFFFIKSQPQITASLLANKILSLNFNNLRIGSNPAIPGIAEIVIFEINFEFILL